MQAFTRSTLNLPPLDEFLARFEDTLNNFKGDQATIRQRCVDEYHRLKTEEVWVNDVYQVNVRRRVSNGFDADITHLSIKRRDKLPIHDWRHLQQIKNMICGNDCEAFEIYPAESRLADSANQYHLWVFPSGMRIPVGFGDRLVCETSEAGAIQRPFETPPYHGEQ